MNRLVLIALLLAAPAQAQSGDTLLRPARVFDGSAIHEGWQVRVRGDRIIEAGPGLPTVPVPPLPTVPGLPDGGNGGGLLGGLSFREMVLGVR